MYAESVRGSGHWRLTRTPLTVTGGFPEDTCRNTDIERLKNGKEAKSDHILVFGHSGDRFYFNLDENLQCFILSQAKSLVSQYTEWACHLMRPILKYLFGERFKYLSSHAMHIENQVFNCIHEHSIRTCAIVFCCFSVVIIIPHG